MKTFKKRDQETVTVNTDRKSVKATDRKNAPVVVNKPRAAVPANLKKIVEAAGIDTTGTMSAQSLNKVLTAVENLLLITRDQLNDLLAVNVKPTVKPDRKVTAPATEPSTKKDGKKQKIEQFVVPSPALKKVYKDAGIAETKDAFRTALAKTKAFGVSINHFNKMIIVDGVELLVYGAGVRGGVCRFVCKNAKGRDVRVDVAEVL